MSGFAQSFLQTPTQLFGANTSGRRNLLDLGLSTLTVSDKAILNCVAINTDKLKCVDVLEMTGTAVFGGNVIFNGPVQFVGPVIGTLNVCTIFCPGDFLLTAAGTSPAACAIDLLALQGDIFIETNDGDIYVRPRGTTGSRGAFFIESERTSTLMVDAAQVTTQSLVVQSVNTGTGNTLLELSANKTVAGGIATVDLLSRSSALATGAASVMNITASHTGTAVTDDATLNISSTVNTGGLGTASLALVSTDIISLNAAGNTNTPPTIHIRADGAAALLSTISIQNDNGTGFGANPAISINAQAGGVQVQGELACRVTSTTTSVTSSAFLDNIIISERGNITLDPQSAVQGDGQVLVDSSTVTQTGTGTAQLSTAVSTNSVSGVITLALGDAGTPAIIVAGGNVIFQLQNTAVTATSTVFLTYAEERTTTNPQGLTVHVESQGTGVVGIRLMNPSVLTATQNGGAPGAPFGYIHFVIFGSA
jgi:hypothetical protein